MRKWSCCVQQIKVNTYGPAEYGKKMVTQIQAANLNQEKVHEEKKEGKEGSHQTNMQNYCVLLHTVLTPDRNCVETEQMIVEISER